MRKLATRIYRAHLDQCINLFITKEDDGYDPYIYVNNAQIDNIDMGKYSSIYYYTYIFV